MKRGFTLLELMIVVLIFTFLFAAILYVLTSSDRSWRTGQDKMTEQQEARKAMDSVARLLRQSNPDWVIGSVHYPVSITGNSRIDFYQPVLDTGGAITGLRKVTFKINPDDSKQLLRKIGNNSETVVANSIDSVNFGGGCAGCAAFNCSTVAEDCPVVLIDVSTKQDKGFSLSSRVTLRNTNIDLSSGVVVEEPAAGEF